MKNLSLFLVIISFALLGGCATTTSVVNGKTVTTMTPIDFTQTKLAKLTNADLDAAAARATANGFPARAQMWEAIKALKVANETQATACAKAIADALPKGAPNVKFAGAADALEAAAETVATFNVSPQIKANCAPIPVPVLAPLPAIPGG